MRQKTISNSFSVTPVFDGKNGDNGVSITSSDVVFVLSDSGSTAPADSVTWKTSFAELDIKNTNASKFVWQAVKVVLSNGTTSYTGKQCLGKVSEFASITEQYALGTASAATGNWQDNTPPSSEKGKYLWTRTKLTYSDNSVGYSPSEAGQCIGYFGTDGKGISSADIMFCLGNSQTTAPGDSSFTATSFAELNIKSTDADKYVWQCIKTTYTSGNPTYSGKVCLGKVSDFASITEQYALGTASAATGNWQDNTPPSSEKGKYLWTRTKLTYSGGGTTYVPSSSGQCVGYFGTDGDDAVMYDIVFDTAWAKVDSEGYITARLEGKAYKIVGSTRSPLNRTTIRFGYILNDNETYTDTTTNSAGGFSADSWFDGDLISDYAKGSNNIFAAIIIDGSVKCVKYVTIANKGDKGDTGRMYYIAGEFPQKAPYYRTDKLCPVVYYATEWWYLDAVSATASNVPSDSSKIWKKIANFGIVITDAIFVKQFAQFGAAIITGDWLISVWGKIYDEYGVETDVNSGSVTEPFYYPSESSTPAYTYFNPNYPNSSAPNVVNFVPNYSVDLKTGKSYQNDCFINGFIRKKKTTITTSNISQYKRDDITSATVLDFDKCGSFIELSTGTYGYFALPLMSAYLASRYTSKQIDDIRSFIGTTMLIYNKSGRDIPMTLRYNSDGTITSGTLHNGNCVELECCLKADDNDGKEIIYWKVIDYAEPVN